MLFKSKGWRENGPYYEESWEWPERDSGWNVFPGYPVKASERWPIEIVAPDLTNFKLKPYVSYRMPEDALTTREFTAKDLFDIACKE
uniref:39S ribosomal protein L41, mitochondrial n=1 Tax=Trichuris muris TaxID=70415 RepID=A0A5S6R2Q6_TRIMR